METLKLSADETRRYWKFSEDTFRVTVREMALRKAKALRSDVLIQDADGFTLGRVEYRMSP